MTVKDILKEKLNIDVTVSEGAWHKNYEEKYGLSITDTKSGCGSMILSGYKNTQPSRFSAFLEIIIPELIENGVGALITTIGQYHPDLMTMVEDNGFEKVSEYNNYRHGENGNYKQYLYIKRL